MAESHPVDRFGFWMSFEIQTPQWSGLWLICVFRYPDFRCHAKTGPEFRLLNKSGHQSAIENSNKFSFRKKPDLGIRYLCSLLAVRGVLKNYSKLFRSVLALVAIKKVLNMIPGDFAQLHSRCPCWLRATRWCRLSGPGTPRWTRNIRHQFYGPEKS